MAGERAVATQGLAAPRLLVISDCMAVLIAIEWAWWGGSAWRLAGHGRAAMLERMLLMRREWQQRGGTMVYSSFGRRRPVAQGRLREPVR